MKRYNTLLWTPEQTFYEPDESSKLIQHAPGCSGTLPANELKACDVLFHIHYFPYSATEIAILRSTLEIRTINPPDPDLPMLLLIPFSGAIQCVPYLPLSFTPTCSAKYHLLHRYDVRYTILPITFDKTSYTTGLTNTVTPNRTTFYLTYTDPGNILDHKTYYLTSDSNIILPSHHFTLIGGI